MKIEHICATALTLTLALSGGAATAQDAPQEDLAQPGAPAATADAPEWWVFSRGQTRHYLIDVHSVARDGDGLTVMVARVPQDRPAGDYTHSVDRFGVQCDARQSRVVASAEAGPDGVLEAPFDTGEDWSAIARDTFDDGVRDIACENKRPAGPPYAGVKAYIDAGRP